MSVTFSNKKILELKNKLDTSRNELILRIVVSLKLDEKFKFSSARQDQRFISLQQETKKIAETLLDNKNFFTIGIDKILQQHEEESTIARVRHEETIAAIATLQGHATQGIWRTTDITDDLNSESLQRLEKIQEGVLNFLWFRFLGDRRAEVSAAYTKTFQWVYDGAIPSGWAWDSLSTWLENGQGCYWINGKAGSGKSTLMKFITGDPRTHQLLTTWAKNDNLLCASFFFWSAGTELQKSQRGLLRSILHECLSQYPELAPIIFPAHCRQIARRHLLIDDPSIVELKAAFQLLTSQTVMSLRICLIIDGVDEYNGDHIELVEWLRSLSSPQLKLLLSSRPTSACSEAFANCPVLQLQDLTQSDIRTYVEGNLGEHPRMRELAQQDKPAVEDLINQVALKSSGVFLWVVIVVRALRNGLRNHDKIHDLYGRLDELPVDLDNLYRRMLNQMDPFYKRQASILLQIMYQSSQVPAHKPMTPLRLSFAVDDNPDSSIDARIGEIDLEEKVRRCRDIEEMVRSRCCGLLEIYRHGSPTFTISVERVSSRGSSEGSVAFRERSNWVLAALAPYLELLHSTQRDLALVLLLNDLRSVSNHDLQRIPVEDLASILLANDHNISTRGGSNLFSELLSDLDPESFVKSEVHFLHKSVIDFLEKPEVWKELQTITAPGGFDPNVSLLNASLHEMKAAPHEFETNIDQSNVWEILLRAFHECALAEISTGQAQDLLIEELDVTMDAHWRVVNGWIPRFNKSLHEMGHWSHTAPSSDSKLSWNHGHIPYSCMFSLACCFGLFRFVNKAIEESRQKQSRESPTTAPDAGKGIGLAQKALNRVILDMDESKLSPRLWNLQLELMALSLEKGADPNLPFCDGKSPWQVAMARCNPRDVSHSQDWATVLQKMIEMGADLNVGHMVDTFVLRFHGEPNSIDIRMWQSPLSAISEKYKMTEDYVARSSRTSARKIKTIAQRLQDVLNKHGGHFRQWFEEEVPYADGDQKVKRWRLVTDPGRIDEIRRDLSD